MPTLESLRDDVATLAEIDRFRQVFGAIQHGWQAEPLPAERLDALEARLGHPLPAAYRRWMGELVGIGAGPFYGLLDPDAPSVEPLDVPAVQLTNHGCGYADHLIVAGEHAGEVWVDFREGHQAPAPWFASLEDWLEAWVRRSFAEWAAERFVDGVPTAEVPPELATRCARVIDALLAEPSPMDHAYPLPADKLWQARATLHLAFGEADRAVAAYDRAAASSGCPEGVRALGRCQVARAAGDAEARLAAADEGLATEGLWFDVKRRLLVHRRLALQDLKRFDEALETVVRIADLARYDLHAQYDLVWWWLEDEAYALAAARLVETAERNVGCDREAPLDQRIAQVVDGLRSALVEAGWADRLAALEEAIRGL